MQDRSSKKKKKMAFKIKKVKPLFTGVITTATTYKGEVKTNGGIILDTRKMEGSINPYQRVVAVGNMVREVKENDIVKINFKRYEKAQHIPGAIDEAQNKQFDNLSIGVEIPSIVINDIEYLYLQVNDIEYIVEEADIDDGGLLQ